MFRRVLFLLSAVALILATEQTDAGYARGHRCGLGVTTCDTLCEHVERTICVPTWVTETRTVTSTECRPEVRERTVTVYRQVAHTKDVECEYTVMVPETRTKTVECTVMKPVWKEVTQECTVMVPHTETRQGIRKVRKLERYEEMRTVCRRGGHWEEQVVQRPALRSHGLFRRHACGGCGSMCYSDPCDCCEICVQTRTRRVWVRDVYTEQIPVTRCRVVWVDEPCEYTVTVCTPETRTQTVKVCEMQAETQTREVQYTVCVPETRTETRQVTTYECVPEEKVVQCTVMVPHQVEKQVEVRVCQMVQKTVSVPVRRRCFTTSCCDSGGPVETQGAPAETPAPKKAPAPVPTKA